MFPEFYDHIIGLIILYYYYVSAELLPLDLCGRFGALAPVLNLSIIPGQVGYHY